MTTIPHCHSSESWNPYSFRVGLSVRMRDPSFRPGDGLSEPISRYELPPAVRIRTCGAETC